MLRSCRQPSDCCRLGEDATGDRGGARRCDRDGAMRRRQSRRQREQAWSKDDTCLEVRAEGAAAAATERGSGALGADWGGGSNYVVARRALRHSTRLQRKGVSVLRSNAWGDFHALHSVNSCTPFTFLALTIPLKFHQRRPAPWAGLSAAEMRHCPGGALDRGSAVWPRSCCAVSTA